MSEGWSYYLDFKDQTFELKDGELTVGRSRTCDISVNDPSVSRRHVVLKAESGRVLLKDLGSSNGTLINGERVEAGGELHDGDSLGLGDADLKVRIAGMSAFETVRMPARPPEQHGDATLFLQKASADLAQEAMELEEASSHMAPPPVASHMAPAPTAPAPAQPGPPVPPAEAQPAASQAASPPIAGPTPTPPPIAAPQPTPPPIAVPTPTPTPPPVAAPPPPVTPPPVAAPQPPQPPPVAAAPEPTVPRTGTEITASPVGPPLPAPSPPEVQDVRLDQTTGDLLPSLDGFDVTMGPEMMAAIKPKEADQPTAVTPAYNPYSAPTAQAQPAAGFGIRLMAMLVDDLWILAIWAGLFFFAGQDNLVASSVACGIGWIVVLFGWAIWGTTPGKRAFNLYVSTGDSAQAGIGFPRALARLVGYVASAIPLCIGFLMIAFSKSKRGLHDIIAGTQVQRQ